jgi:hypothetical protein
MQPPAGGCHSQPAAATWPGQGQGCVVTTVARAGAGGVVLTKHSVHGHGQGYGKAGARVMVAEAWQEWWQGRGGVVVSAQDRVVARSGLVTWPGQEEVVCIELCG